MNSAHFEIRVGKYQPKTDTGQILTSVFGNRNPLRLEDLPFPALLLPYTQSLTAEFLEAPRNAKAKKDGQEQEA